MEDCALSQAQRWALLLALAVLPSATVHGDDKPSDFFDSTNLVTFRVDLDEAELRRLAERPRSYAAGKVSIGEQVFTNVGVRLKGTGTFEAIYARPSLTLKFNWKHEHQQFAGLAKLFLENSGQDASRLCKLVANGAFADGGVPAPRISQGRVELNGRDLGMYVVSEAINKGFLKRHFGNAEGNLYEAEFRDLDVPLKQDNGPPCDQSDLRELAAAAKEKDHSRRRQALDRVLQTDEFLDFLAIEMIIANWDGYAIAQNNYRVYHDPASGRMSFIPHDLDNTFSESGMGLMPPRRGVLTSALLETPEERAAFRQRVAGLLPKVLDPERIGERVRASVARLSQGASPEQIELIQHQAAVLQQRVQERLRHLTEELAGTRPPTPVFDSRGVAALDGWIPKTDWNNALVKAVVEDGKPCLSIQAANRYCFGSWRLRLWLPAGGYRIEASAKTSGVAGLPSRTGSGAGVRVVGNRRGGGLQDSSNWAPLRHSFVVQEDCEYVELIAELRAYTGTAWFDPESLKLIRVR